MRMAITKWVISNILGVLGIIALLVTTIIIIQANTLATLLGNCSKSDYLCPFKIDAEILIVLLVIMIIAVLSISVVADAMINSIEFIRRETIGFFQIPRFGNVKLSFDESEAGK